jgi:TatD DNase family protein
MPALVDTHCHIDLPDFDSDRDAMFDRAAAAGVAAMVVIGFSPDRWVSTGELIKERSNVVRAVGLHPNEASLWDVRLHDALHAELDKGDAVALGEIGLDYYRNRANRESQLDAFGAQIDIARQRGLPIIVHQREAEQDILATLDRSGAVPGVMHCFSGDRVYARQCLDRGLYLGVGGVVSYPRSEAIREAVRLAPLDRLILETDAPFLAPQGRRGKRNEPALVAEVLDIVADLHRCHRDEVAEATTNNAVHLFDGLLADALSTSSGVVAQP